MIRKSMWSVLHAMVGTILTVPPYQSGQSIQGYNGDVRNVNVNRQKKGLAKMLSSVDN